ncbi:dTMP kinase [bacterium M21]|nr:dTMP kinase [bacterium M21]
MTQKQIPNGLFITLEGPDCAGKSTQATQLAAYLRDAGYDVLETREPGGTKIGEELRNLVKHVVGDDAPCSEAELFMFSAARAQITRKVILPHLATGGIVLCDRYADSTTAYQGYGRGLDLEMIETMHEIAVIGRWPDVTILMDLEPEVSRRRHESREETKGIADRFEDEERAFHERVRNGYLELAKKHPQRFSTVNADDAIDHIQSQIREVVDRAIS